MKPLSPLMLRVLVDIHEGRGAWQNCKDRGSAGGRGNTVKALIRRRLISYRYRSHKSEFNIEATTKGRELLLQLEPSLGRKLKDATKKENSLLRVLRCLLGKKPIQP